MLGSGCKSRSNFVLCKGRSLFTSTMSRRDQLCLEVVANLGRILFFAKVGAYLRAQCRGGINYAWRNRWRRHALGSIDGRC